MKTWYEAMAHCREVYGVHVNKKNRFFCCPECGEPLSEEDWEDHVDWSECPICGFDWEEDGE